MYLKRVVTRPLLISFVALAIESGRRVDALVCTLVKLHSGAFVDVAVGGLVAVVRTIRHLITDQRRVDALAICTSELVDTARGDVFPGTVELVRIVPAVVLVIAPVRTPDALEILACKLSRRTRLVLRMTVFALVRTVAAVVVVVAHPSLVDAPPVTARELLRAAIHHRRTVERRDVLVRPVHAVGISVAQPLPRYALRSVPRLVRLTRELCGLVALSIIYKNENTTR